MNIVSSENVMKPCLEAITRNNQSGSLSNSQISLSDSQTSLSDLSRQAILGVQKIDCLAKL